MSLVLQPEIHQDEPKTFCKIATALAKTVEIQKEINELCPEVEMAVIEPVSAPVAAPNTP